MKTIPISKIKKVHFIGIGGIGVSALARFMIHDGKKVSGSDINPSPIIAELRKAGAKIFIGHKEKNLGGADFVVHTTAISPKNPELTEAKKRGLPVFSYPQMLGFTSRDKFTIAVSGAHGKTTTTAMIGAILKTAGLDPTIIVGSLLKKPRSNFIPGRGKHLVVEACEYRKAFLNLDPKIIVITNIDNDHLDYYKNFNAIIAAFSEFVLKLGEKDFVVCDPSARAVKQAVKNARCQIIDYQKFPVDFKLGVHGEHNVNNAKAALAVADILGIKKTAAKNALRKFTGTWRRFEHRGKTRGGALVFDDYAHHPTEIRATLGAARFRFPKKRIVCVFQPHLFSRTKLLLDQFASSFGDADLIIIPDIYAAREKDDGQTHSGHLIQKVQKHHPGVMYVPSLTSISEFLGQNIRKSDIIITMGAGDIYQVANRLVNHKFQ